MVPSVKIKLGIWEIKKPYPEGKGFPSGTVVKHLPANTGDLRDTGLSPGLGRSPGGECRAAHSSILAWRTPWTKKLGRLQFIGSYRVGHD